MTCNTVQVEEAGERQADGEADVGDVPDDADTDDTSAYAARKVE